MTVNSILDRLAGQGRTLAVAESPHRGGLLAAAFVDVSGASLVFRGGIVTLRHRHEGAGTRSRVRPRGAANQWIRGRR